MTEEPTGFHDPKMFQEMLGRATGVSRHQIIIFLDVRGFSSFSRTQDAVDVATYLKGVYPRLMEKFPLASFVKATGDGLLVAVPYTEEDLKDKAESTVRACIEIVQSFKEICRDDPMVNFNVPGRIGIGVTRGSACAITADGQTLDLSGHRLNLAARLMDMARPEGIVIDESFGSGFIPEDLRGRFRPEEMYMRSIAEGAPHQTLCLDTVVIPSFAKRPLMGEQWETLEFLRPAGELLEGNEDARFFFTDAVREPDSISVALEQEVLEDDDATLSHVWVVDDFDYRDDTGEHSVTIGRELLEDFITHYGLSKDAKVRIKIRYVADEPTPE